MMFVRDEKCIVCDRPLTKGRRSTVFWLWCVRCVARVSGASKKRKVASLTAALKEPASETEIPVWFVEVLARHGYVEYHLRLSPKVAEWLEMKLCILMARKKIHAFKVQRVEDLVVPAFQFYDHFGLDG